MQKRMGILELIAGAADLPPELLPGMPILEFAGHNRVMIENHGGVTEYADNRICVPVSFGAVILRGRNLRIARMQKKLLVVVGKIDSVEFERKHGHG